MKRAVYRLKRRQKLDKLDKTSLPEREQRRNWVGTVIR